MYVGETTEQMWFHFLKWFYIHEMGEEYWKYTIKPTEKNDWKEYVDGIG